jgi:hypothetical protein
VNSYAENCIKPGDVCKFLDDYYIVIACLVDELGISYVSIVHKEDDVCVEAQKVTPVDSSYKSEVLGDVAVVDKVTDRVGDLIGAGDEVRWGWDTFTVAAAYNDTTPHVFIINGDCCRWVNSDRVRRFIPIP